MPTGPRHYVIRKENGPSSFWDEPCRCIIGHNHTPDGIGVYESDLERWDREAGRSRPDDWSGDD